jgi:hypothetical protein
MNRVLVIRLALLLALCWPTAVLAQDENRAALVVSLEDGRVITRCVAFTEPHISGYDLLLRSGLALETGVGGQGTSVCRIEGTGCGAADCFCQCRGAACRYWSYWHWQDGAWRYAQAGAAVYQVGDGAVEGWTWGPGSVTEAIQPPAVSFDEICVADATAPVSATAAAETPAAPPTVRGQWPLYALFALIVAGLGTAVLLAGRRVKE